MWYGERYDFMIMYAMIMFCNFTTCMSMSMATGRSLMVVLLLLYGVRAKKNLTPCNCFTLSLRVAIVVVAIVGGDNHEMASSCWCFGDGDQRHKKKGYTMSQIKLHVMFILYAPYCYALM